MFESKTNFENLRVYQLASELGDLVWEIAYRWEYTARDTIGKQLINSADSVGANIADGMLEEEALLKISDLQKLLGVHYLKSSIGLIEHTKEIF